MSFKAASRLGWLIFEILPYPKGSNTDKYKTDHPSDRLADTYCGISFERYDPECKDDLSDQLEETAKKREDLVAHTLESISHDGHKAHRREHYCADLKIEECIFYHSRITASCDQADSIRRCKEDEQDCDQPPNQVKFKGDLYAAPDTGAFFRTIVLAGKSSHAGGECTTWHHKKFCETTAADLRCDIDISQCIDTSLQNNTADAEDGVHQSHAHTCVEHFQDEAGSCVEIFSFHTKLRIVFQDIEKAEYNTDSLRQDRSGGSTLNPETKRSHK